MKKDLFEIMSSMMNKDYLLICEIIDELCVCVYYHHSVELEGYCCKNIIRDILYKYDLVQMYDRVIECLFKA